MKNKDNRLITTRRVFTISIIVAVITIVGIWLFGIGKNRTIFENSILSTSILSLSFFLFIAIGLYKGIKLKDNIGKLTDKIKIDNIPDLSAGFEFSSQIPILGEGIAGIILGILLWILFSILIIIFIWLFEAALWIMILIFIAMLYWIFFRALRLVFKNSNKCKGDLTASIVYGFGYTLLYNFWIYCIIMMSHYMIK